MKRFALLAGLLLIAQSALAYPEFEVWSEKNSGKVIDCARCHTNAEGPEGVKPGQIRSLSPPELERLNQARSAFEPGMGVDSPVLNAFGDRIIDKLGKKKFIEIRSANPGQLVTLYGTDSDLDGDGIPDVREYAEGTLPTDSRSGNPWTLFSTNVQRSWLDILMTVLATLFGLYGLNQLLRWFHHEAEAPAAVEERKSDLLPYLARRAASRRRAR